MMVRMTYFMLPLLTISAYAAVWRDDFNDENLPGWTLIGRKSKWKMEDGTLKVELHLCHDEVGARHSSLNA